MRRSRDVFDTPDPLSDQVVVFNGDAHAYLSLAEVAEYTRFSQDYLSLLARKGVIGAKKFGRNWKVRMCDVEAYIARVDARAIEMERTQLLANPAPADKTRWQWARLFGRFSSHERIDNFLAEPERLTSYGTQTAQAVMATVLIVAIVATSGFFWLSPAAAARAHTGVEGAVARAVRGVRAQAAAAQAAVRQTGAAGFLALTASAQAGFAALASDDAPLAQTGARVVARFEATGARLGTVAAFLETRTQARQAYLRRSLATTGTETIRALDTLGGDLAALVRTTLTAPAKLIPPPIRYALTGSVSAAETQVARGANVLEGRKDQLFTAAPSGDGQVAGVTVTADAVPFGHRALAFARASAAAQQATATQARRGTDRWLNGLRSQQQQLGTRIAGALTRGLNRLDAAVARKATSGAQAVAGVQAQGDTVADTFWNQLGKGLGSTANAFAIAETSWQAEQDRSLTALGTAWSTALDWLLPEAFKDTLASRYAASAPIAATDGAEPAPAVVRETVVIRTQGGEQKETARPPVSPRSADLALSGDLSVAGTTTLADLTVTGGARFVADTDFVGPLYSSSGILTVNDDLRVNGRIGAQLLNVDGTIEAGALYTRGRADIGGPLTAGDLTVRGDATIDGTLEIAGVFFAESLAARHSVTAYRSLGTAGTLHVGESGTIDENLTVGENLTVEDSLTVSRHVTIGGNIAADGAFSLVGDATLASDLSVGGDTTLSGTAAITGNTTVGGTLGVTGDTTIGGNLDVTGTTDFTGTTTFSAIVVTASSTQAAALINQTGTGSILQLQDGGADILTVADGGNITYDTTTLFMDASLNRVGIGTTTPASRLSVWGADSGTGANIFDIVNAASSTLLTVLDNGYTGIGDATPDFGLEVAASSSLGYFAVSAGAEGAGDLFVIKGDGKIGIGTTSPSVSLAIAGTDAILLPVGTAAQRPTGYAGMIRYNSDITSFEGYNGIGWSSLGGVIDLDRDTYILTESTSGADEDVLSFYTGGTQRLQIGSDGRVGLGTTTPSGKLTVWADGTSGLTAFNVVDTASSTLFTVLDDGKVGIGTTTPGTALGVVGSGVFTSNLTVEGTTGATLSGAGAGITFTGAGDHLISATAGTLKLGTTVIVGDIEAVDGTVDIGTPATRFRTVYADEVNATTLVGTLTGGNLIASTFTINSDNASADGEDGFIAFERGSVTPNAIIAWDSGADEMDLNAPLHLTGTLASAVGLTLDGFTLDLTTGTNQDLILTPNGTGRTGIGTSTPSATLTVWSPDESGSTAFNVVNSASSTLLSILSGGNVGIGTTTPFTTFAVDGNGYFSGTLGVSGLAAFGNASSTSWSVSGNTYLSQMTAGSLLFAGADGLVNQDNSKLFWDDSNDRLGIGTTTPNQKLSIFNSAADAAIEFSAASGDAYKWTAGLDYSNSGSFTVSSSTALGTNSRFVLHSNGNAVILGSAGGSGLTAAAASPQGTLELAATDPYLVFNKASYNIGEGDTAKYWRVGNVNGSLRFDVNTSEVTPFGSISSPLTLTGSGATITQLAVNSTTATSTFSTGGLTVGTSQFVVQQTSGNVGIGTSSPYALLSVAGNAVIDGSLTLTTLTATSSIAAPYFTASDAAATSTFAGGLAVGTTRLVVDSTTGYVGVGTASPGEVLDVVGNVIIPNNNEYRSKTSTGGTTNLIKINDSNIIQIGRLTDSIPIALHSGSAGAETMRLTGGNVGIGTTTPDSKLTVHDGDFTLTDTDVVNPLSGVYGGTTYGYVTPLSGTAGGLDIRGISDTDGGGLRLIGTMGSADPTDATPAVTFVANKFSSSNATQNLGSAETAFQFANGSSNLLTILGNGNVGIGTTNPANGRLQVQPAARGGHGILLTDTDASAAVSLYLDASGNGEMYMYDAAANLQNYISAASGVSSYINNGGKVGIGTTTPDSKLTIYASSGKLLNLETNEGSKIVVDNAGRMGIGLTTPTYLLDIQSATSSLFRIATSSTGTIFSVTDTQISANVPFNLNMAGDVQFGSDLVFTSNTSASIKSNSPLYITAGNAGQNVDLALKANNLGEVVIDDQLRILGDGSSRDILTIASSTGTTLGVFTAGGYLGIATSSPYGLLSIEQGTEAASFWVGNTGSSTPSLMVSGVNGDGRVGIGTASPIYGKLQINGSGATGGLALWTGGADTTSRFYNDATTDTLNINRGGDTAKGLVINSTGKVGIGSSTPTAKLVVESTGTTNLTIKTSHASSKDAYLEYHDAGGREWLAGMGISSATTGSYEIYEYENGVAQGSRFVIAEGGNVGIGTTSPFAKLAVENTGAGHSFLVGDEANDTTPFVIDASGNVGIGTASPSGKLDIVGTAGGVNALRLRSGDINSIPPDSNQILFSYDTSVNYTHAIKTRHNNGGQAGNAIDFYTWNYGTDADATIGTKHVMTLDGNGNVGIATTSPVAKLGITQSANGVRGLEIYDTSSGATTNTALLYRSNNSTSPSTSNALVRLVDHANNYPLSIETTAGASLLSVQGVGRVGIGTASPQYALDINMATSSLFRIASSTDEIFTVTTQQATFNVPLNLNTAGDVNMGSDLVFTDSAYSSILSNGSLYLTAGTVAQAGNIYLKGMGTGQIVADDKLTVLGDGSYNDYFKVQATSTLFSVSPVQATLSVPFNLSSPGDVQIASDLVLTNNTSGNILSNAPLYIIAGDMGQNVDLTLKANNTGQVVIDDDLVIQGSATTTYALNIETGLTSKFFRVATSTANDIFTIQDTQITANVPFNLNTVGNVQFGSDLEFTDNTSANILSASPLYITAGDSGQNTSVYLKGQGTGVVYVDDGLYVASTTSIRTEQTTWAFAVDWDGDGDATYAYVNNSNAFTNGSADYAEFFWSEDTDLAAGETVCVDVTRSNAVKRCDRGSDGNLMGIISTSPAFLGNAPGEEHRESNPNYKMVAMLGQIPAKVSTENGEIRPGDSLTSASSTPGYVMRANAGDPTVGVALESLASSTGEINVLISRRNKSLTVEEIEDTVVERVAAMEIEDEVAIMVQQAVEAYDFDPVVSDIIGTELASLSSNFDSALTVQRDELTQLIANQGTSVDTALAALASAVDAQGNMIAALQAQLADADFASSTVSGTLTVSAEGGTIAEFKRATTTLFAITADNRVALADDVRLAFGDTDATTFAYNSATGRMEILGEKDLYVSLGAGRMVIAGATLSSLPPLPQGEEELTLDVQGSTAIRTHASSTAVALTVMQNGNGDIVEFRNATLAVMTVKSEGAVEIAGGILEVCVGACPDTESFVLSSEGDLGVEAAVVAGEYRVHCPEGWVEVPRDNKNTFQNFCVQATEFTYGELAQIGTDTETDEDELAPVASVSLAQARNYCRALGTGYHLVTEAEWMTVAEHIAGLPINDLRDANMQINANLQIANGAANISAPLNAPSVHPSTFSCNVYASLDSEENAYSETCQVQDVDAQFGYSDTGASFADEYDPASAGRASLRTHLLPNGQVIWDLAGNVAEWTDALSIAKDGPEDDTPASEWLEYGDITSFANMSFIRPSDTTLTSAAGAGKLYTDAGAGNATRGAVRGGSYLDGEKAGVFSLNLGYSPTHTSNDIGFRCAR